MQTYDFRISDEAVNNASKQIDRLSNRDLLKLSEAAEELQHEQEEERITKAKEYFNNVILPSLKDFAEMTSSILDIEERDENMSIQAIFRNEMGFDITESCRLMRVSLMLANHIGIMTEGKFTTLSLVYDYKEMLDY